MPDVTLIGGLIFAHCSPAQVVPVAEDCLGRTAQFGREFPDHSTIQRLKPTGGRSQSVSILRSRRDGDRRPIGFLVDPYFRIGQLPVILDSTSISRVLISKQYKNSKVARAELQTALMTLPRLRHIEIRATASDTLHDRVLITEDDDVYMLGASLQSIGTSTTVYMAVPKAGVAPIRGEMEDLWNGAELVGVSVTEAIKDENLDET